MLAAAVIPAPIAYLKVAAVKKLVVGSRNRADGRPLPIGAPSMLLSEAFTLKKLECSKQARSPEYRS